MERTDRSSLPTALRPFAGWKPERLAASRPRRAIAEALTADSRLRKTVGEELEERRLWVASETTDAGRLLLAYGAEDTVAALAARARWDDLAVVAAESADRLAARDRAAAETARRQEAETDALARGRLSHELVATRAERDAHRRRADSAEQRGRQTEAEQTRLAERVTALEAESDDLRAQLAAERRRAQRQTARLRRRLDEATERVRMDDARVAEVAARLESLAGRLRRALEPGAEPGRVEPLDTGEDAGLLEDLAGDPEDVAGDVPPNAHGPAKVPREVPAATAGRPCRLPPGLLEDDPLAVHALLQVPGIEVLLDGYNLTKDPAGRPLAALEDQRGWLLRLAGGLAARFDRRMTVVFDGTEVLHGTGRPPRGVRLCFTTGEEDADTRIVALVRGFAVDQPVLVATSDRRVRADVAELGANVTSARAFLHSAGA
ncbi:MAG: hypothetical protein GEU81_01975 [Nitriliruptorales bacterium]|nr:hypothetical protein [Nitriliruptorales bacterium]